MAEAAGKPHHVTSGSATGKWESEQMTENTASAKWWPPQRNSWKSAGGKKMEWGWPLGGHS